MMPPCGKVCNDRKPGCHSTCAAYQEYRKKMDEIGTNRYNDKKFCSRAELAMYRHYGSGTKF